MNLGFEVVLEFNFDCKSIDHLEKIALNTSEMIPNLAATAKQPDIIEETTVGSFIYLLHLLKLVPSGRHLHDLTVKDDANHHHKETGGIRGTESSSISPPPPEPQVMLGIATVKPIDANLYNRQQRTSSIARFSGHGHTVIVFYWITSL